jgi:hypothetical protein
LPTQCRRGAGLLEVGCLCWLPFYNDNSHIVRVGRWASAAIDVMPQPSAWYCGCSILSSHGIVQCIIQCIYISAPTCAAHDAVLMCLLTSIGCLLLSKHAEAAVCAASSHRRC